MPSARPAGGARPAASAARASRKAPPILARQVRGEIVESVHRGHVVRVDATGRVTHVAGDAEAEVTLRSCVKPFALVALAEAGGFRDYGLIGGRDRPHGELALGRGPPRPHAPGGLPSVGTYADAPRLRQRGRAAGPADLGAARPRRREGRARCATCAPATTPRCCSWRASATGPWRTTGTPGTRSRSPSAPSSRAPSSTTPERLRTAIDGCGVRDVRLPARRRRPRVRPPGRSRRHPGRRPASEPGAGPADDPRRHGRPPGDGRGLARPARHVAHEGAPGPPRRQGRRRGPAGHRGAPGEGERAPAHRRSPSRSRTARASNGRPGRRRWRRSASPASSRARPFASLGRYHRPVELDPHGRIAAETIAGFDLVPVGRARRLRRSGSGPEGQAAAGRRPNRWVGGAIGARDEDVGPGEIERRGSASRPRRRPRRDRGGDQARLPRPRQAPPPRCRPGLGGPVPGDPGRLRGARRRGVRDAGPAERRRRGRAGRLAGRRSRAAREATRRRRERARGRRARSGPGTEWARRPRGGSARRPGAGSAGGDAGRPVPGRPGTRAARPAGRAGRAAGRTTCPAGGARRRRRRATLGSTSYDGAEEVFEPDWGGASLVRAERPGTYWTINPKEYADPRKHGPEYQARARRRRGGAAGPGAGSSGRGIGRGGTARRRARAPGSRQRSTRPTSRVPPRKPVIPGAGAAGSRRRGGPTPGPRQRRRAPRGLPSSTTRRPMEGRRAAWPEPGGPPPGRRAPARSARSRRLLVRRPARRVRRRRRQRRGRGSRRASSSPSPGGSSPAWRSPRSPACPAGLLATLPLQVAGVAVLALVPRAAWASIGGSLALVFAAIPIVAVGRRARRSVRPGRARAGGGGRPRRASPGPPASCSSAPAGSRRTRGGPARDGDGGGVAAAGRPGARGVRSPRDPPRPVRSLERRPGVPPRAPRGGR